MPAMVCGICTCAISTSDQGPTLISICRACLSSLRAEANTHCPERKSRIRGYQIEQLGQDAFQTSGHRKAGL